MNRPKFFRLFSFLGVISLHPLCKLLMTEWRGKMLNSEDDDDDY